VLIFYLNLCHFFVCLFQFPLLHFFIFFHDLFMCFLSLAGSLSLYFQEFQVVQGLHLLVTAYMQGYIHDDIVS
jgi:hypothetical protein